MEKKKVYSMIATFAILGISLLLLGCASSEDAPGQEAPVAAQASSASKVSGGTDKVDSSGEAYLGSEDAQILIEEYSDFQCPFCARASPTIHRLAEEYKDEVKIVFRHFPLRQIHENAQKAAEASECAADQGMFWEYHDILFENQGNLGVSSLKQHASELGLDKNEFDACLDSGEKYETVNSEMREGISKGVKGTPAFFINGKMISGAQPYEVFKAEIDSQLGG